MACDSIFFELGYYRHDAQNPAAWRRQKPLGPGILSGTPPGQGSPAAKRQEHTTVSETQPRSVCGLAGRQVHAECCACSEMAQNLPQTRQKTAPGPDPGPARHAWPLAGSQSFRQVPSPSWLGCGQVHALFIAGFWPRSPPPRIKAVVTRQIDGCRCGVGHVATNPIPPAYPTLPSWPHHTPPP